MTPTCKTCRFWMPSQDRGYPEHEVVPGICRAGPRYEPHDRHDWCGEHQPREAEEQSSSEIEEVWRRTYEAMMLHKAAAEKPKERKLDCYWVRMAGRSRWCPAIWSSIGWFLPGVSASLQDGELDEIDERPIRRGDA